MKIKFLVAVLAIIISTAAPVSAQPNTTRGTAHTYDWVVKSGGGFKVIVGVTGIIRVVFARWIRNAALNASHSLRCVKCAQLWMLSLLPYIGNDYTVCVPGLNWPCYTIHDVKAHYQWDVMHHPTQLAQGLAGAFGENSCLSVRLRHRDVQAWEHVSTGCGN